MKNRGFLQIFREDLMHGWDKGNVINVTREPLGKGFLQLFQVCQQWLLLPLN